MGVYRIVFTLWQQWPKLILKFAFNSSQLVKKTMALWFTDFVGMALVLLSSCKATKRELWIGGFFTVDVSDGGWSSAGVLPSVQMALADVNNSTKLLKDYILKMDWRDTKVSSIYYHRQQLSRNATFRITTKPLVVYNSVLRAKRKPIYINYKL